MAQSCFQEPILIRFKMKEKNISKQYNVCKTTQKMNSQVGSILWERRTLTPLLQVNVYSLTFYRWTDLLIDHRHWITNRKWMTSRMTNTNVIRVVTSVIWRSTRSKLGTSHPKKTTNTSVIITTHMKTTTWTIRRTLIILRYPIAYLRIHSNYRQTKLIARHTKRNKNQISEILKKDFSMLDERKHNRCYNYLHRTNMKQ